MSEVPRFEVGEHWRDSREKLNRIVDALNALRRMEGDEIVAVNREGDNLLLDTSIDQISARLPARQFLYAKIVDWQDPAAEAGVDIGESGDGWVRDGDNDTFAICYAQRCDSAGDVQNEAVLAFSYYNSPAKDPNIRIGDVVPYDNIGRHIVGHYDDDKIDTVKIWFASDIDSDIPPGWVEEDALDGRVPVGPDGGEGEIDSGELGKSGGSAKLPGEGLEHDHGLNINLEEEIMYQVGATPYTGQVADTPTEKSLDEADDIDITPPFYTVRFIKRVD